MTLNRPLRCAAFGLALLTSAIGLGACAAPGDLSSQAPSPGANAVDTRATALPGSVMPSIGGAGNGGGVSGGGAGTGSFGGGR